MAMNPDTNKFEIVDHDVAGTLDKAIEAKLEKLQGAAKLLRPDGSPVPKHWTVLATGEHVVIKDYTFKVAYINETTLILEPVGVPEIGTTGLAEGD